MSTSPQQGTCSHARRPGTSIANDNGTHHNVGADACDVYYLDRNDRRIVHDHRIVYDRRPHDDAWRGASIWLYLISIHRWASAFRRRRDRGNHFDDAQLVTGI